MFSFFLLSFFDVRALEKEFLNILLFCMEATFFFQIHWILKLAFSFFLPLSQTVPECKDFLSENNLSVLSFVQLHSQTAFVEGNENSGRNLQTWTEILDYHRHFSWLLKDLDNFNS